MPEGFAISVLVSYVKFRQKIHGATMIFSATNSEAQDLLSSGESSPLLALLGGGVFFSP